MAMELQADVGPCRVPVTLDLPAVVGRVRAVLPRRRMIRNERPRLRLSSFPRAKSQLRRPLSLTLPHKGGGDQKGSLPLQSG